MSLFPIGMGVHIVCDTKFSHILFFVPTHWHIHGFPHYVILIFHFTFHNPTTPSILYKFHFFRSFIYPKEIKISVLSPCLFCLLSHISSINSFSYWTLSSLTPSFFLEYQFIWENISIVLLGTNTNHI